MTEFLDVPDGRIAYDVTGSGPLVVLSHGIGVSRQDYRFLAPMLAQAGYRVANADLRGHGESSMGWASITRTDVAGDLLALTGHLGGPAVIVGHSISGGAATIAAATRPEQVAGIVEINPFTRQVHYSLGGLLRVRRYRRCLFLLTGTTSPGRSRELPGPALSTGTSRRGTAGHAHRHRRRRNHATCVMAFHADRREARVDSTTGPYRRIPKRLDPARPRERPLRRDANNHRRGPGNGRASISDHQKENHHDRQPN